MSKVLKALYIEMLGHNMIVQGCRIDPNNSCEIVIYNYIDCHTNDIKPKSYRRIHKYILGNKPQLISYYEKDGFIGNGKNFTNRIRRWLSLNV